MIWHIQTLAAFTNSVQCLDPKEGWKPLRPISLGYSLDSFKAAWLVFTGKADALIWESRNIKLSKQPREWI